MLEADSRKPLGRQPLTHSQDDEEGELRFLLLEFAPPTSLPLHNRCAAVFPLFRVTPINGILVETNSHILVKDFCSIGPTLIASNERFVCAIFIWEKKP